MVASVVLNGARSSTRVSEATRKRILEVAEQLGYRRNAAALGLSRRKMNCLGVTCVVDGSEINYYFLAVLNGILEGAAVHGQNVTVFSLGDWLIEERKIFEFCDGRIDGMILIGPRLSENFSTRPCHTPFVTIHGDREIPYGCNLDIDNEMGARMMVRYLIALGHRRILHISGGDSPGPRERVAGYCHALEEAGIAPDPLLIVPGTFSTVGGRRVTEALLQRLSGELPTAIFCASDAIAYGCMEVLRTHGIRVPEDVSVVGFDDMLLASMTDPPLTTVRQPFRTMGQRAVEILLTQIHNERVGPTVSDAHASDPLTIPVVHTELFTTELVIRESATPPARM
jgi:LacI family transcriptional regulator